MKLLTKEAQIPIQLHLDPDRPPVKPLMFGVDLRVNVLEPSDHAQVHNTTTIINLLSVCRFPHLWLTALRVRDHVRDGGHDLLQGNPVRGEK